jgi:hypothetical protein
MWVSLKSEKFHCSVRVWQRVEELPCTCNVPFSPWKSKNIIYSECVFVALVIKHEKRVHRIILISVAYSAVPCFSTLFHKRHDLRGKSCRT